MSDNPTPLSNVVLLLSALLLLTTFVVAILAMVPSAAAYLHVDRFIQFYLALRKPLLKLVFGTELDLPWRHALVDYIFVWANLFFAINVFIYRNEEVLLWGHIRKNYCSRVSSRWLGTQLCTLVRFCAAAIALPYACLRIYLQSFQRGRTLFTSCYVTLSPDEIAQYLKYLGYAFAIVAASAVVAGLLATETAPHL